MLVTLDRLQILVLHGPNLDLLGRREPHIYDALTMEDINQRLRLLAAELGVDLEIVQCVGVSFSLSRYHPITL